MERNVNCISFIYHRFGIKHLEEYRSPPTVSEVYRYFDEVETLDEADVIAAGFASNDSEIIFHMAAINEDRKSVTHREGYGKSVTPQSLDEFFLKYNKARFGEVFRIIFLKKK
jgi:hypothetical protein